MLLVVLENVPFIYPPYLNFVGGDCSCSFQGELEDRGSGTPKEVGPKHWVDVGGLAVSPACFFLPSTSPMLWIVELH